MKRQIGIFKYVLIVMSLSLLGQASFGANPDLFQSLEQGQLSNLRKAPAATLRKLRNAHGESLLIRAIARQDGVARDFLLQGERSELNYRDPSGQTALFYAVAQGDLASVKALLKKKPDLEILYGAKNQNILFEAVRSGDLDVVKALRACRATLLEQLDSEGKSVLEAAIQAAQYTLASKLVREMGASWPQDPARRSALIKELKGSKTESARDLLSLLPQ